MDALSTYMAEKHSTLARDYLKPYQVYAESCMIIAAKIAKLLLDRGEQPHILEITGRFDGVNCKTLIPKLFERRVKWGSHQICCLDEFVYDPMVSVNPIPKKDYAMLAFGENVDMSVFVSSERVREHSSFFT
jgi:hypothetical protein